MANRSSIQSPLNNWPTSSNLEDGIKGIHQAGPYFVDLFAGCGGLSLGLLNSGWKGLFAIEKHPDPFKTLSANLINGKRSFEWPSWLPMSAICTSTLLNQYEDELKSYKGRVALIAGSPPCQGFSVAGRRIHTDPRNELSRDYLRIVELIQPTFLIMENVSGFALPFKKHGTGIHKDKAHSQIIKDQLIDLGYEVQSKLIDLSCFGLPQRRKRFILIGVRKENYQDLGIVDLISALMATTKDFRRLRGLKASGPYTARQALFDLETAGKKLKVNTECRLSGFKEAEYIESKKKSSLIRYLRLEADGAPTSLRLANHRPSTIEHFKRIQDTCRPGFCINDNDRKRLNLKKHSLTPLIANKPSSTITTLPDDILHYSEPRILTVRENARLQTFPDWFEFYGKYTSGGKSRRLDCPRYTQVGNAVPPLFAEALGSFLLKLYHSSMP